MNNKNQKHPILIHSLLQPLPYNHPVRKIELVETHISWVILTGDYAYKIKKPCNLGFLDFSTLVKRKYYCEEELRLNQRLASPIYLGIIAITGTPQQPVLQGTDQVIEYAIKMIQFPQHAQLDRMLAAGKLDHHHMDAFAYKIANFHRTASIAKPDTDFGNPDHVYHAVVQTFDQIRQQADSIPFDTEITELETWSKATFDKLTSLFEQRKQDGFIRECHGDMHLRNLIWWNNEPLAFDCLEFDPDLRWIDTLSEVAFLVMDLDSRKQQKLAQRFLNTYLEQTGDYAGMPIFRFYLVYRAIVRAMVDLIRGGHPDISPAEKQAAKTEFLAYLKLADSYCQHKKPLLIITHGLSASGKSTLSQPLLEQIGAIRIRSDVERKRMFGLFTGLSRLKHTVNSATEEDKASRQTDDIYTVDANLKTYARLSILAENILNAGFSVIIDAAFLKYEERLSFLTLACTRQWPFIILAFTASADTLRQRIQARKNDVSDANLEVLEMQLEVSEPLHDDELPYRITIDTEKEFDTETLILQITKHIQQDAPNHA